MKTLLQSLIETPSPSGYEAQIRQVIGNQVASLADEMYTDALGNLIVRKGEGGPQGRKIMLSAHMDEIGVMVTHVDENGFVRFTTLGGVRALNCVGGRVRFLNGLVGVIGCEKLDDASKVPPFEKLYIDIGVTSRQDCPLRVGDVAAFDRPLVDLGQRVIAKAMDDRVGCAVLIETLRQLAETPHRVYFVFSTQEEVGLRGATTAAFGLDPDLALAVDVTGVGDTPKSHKMEVSLGKGPAIKVRDGGMLSDPLVIDWMVRAAEKASIPYQLEVLEGGTTDARAMQITRAGVPAGCLSIPTRYIHSPSEMVDMDDVQNSVRLLLELLQAPVELG
jgi:endoglucanase